MPINLPLSLRLNSIFVSSGNVIRLVVSLISIPLLVRFLGLERYGVWAVLNSVIAIGTLMELGISTALTYSISTSSAKQDWLSTKYGLSTSLTLITCLGVISSLLLWLASSSIVNILFSNEKLGRVEALPALTLLSWLILLRFWQQWAMAVEAALLRYDLQIIVETFSGVILQLGIVVIAYTKGDLLLLTVWSLCITGLTLVGHYLVLKYLLIIRNLWIRFSWKEARDLVRFGILQWLSNFGSTLFGFADKIFVNLLLGAEAAGLYSAATSVAIQINSLSAIPLRVIPPAISSAKAVNQLSRIQQIFLRATQLNGLFVFLIAAPIMFWSHPLAGILVGHEYVNPTAKILQILAVAYGIYSLNASAFFTAVGIGQPILNARWGLISGILFCIFLLVFTSLFGIIGAAWANIIFAISLMTNFQVVKVIKINYWTYIKSFLPAVLMITLWGFVSTFINNKPSISLSINIPLFIILGMISIFFVGGYAILKEIINTFVTIENKKIRFKKIL